MAIFHYFAQFSAHMEIPESDHVIAYAAVTHPYLPRRLRNMLLGSLTLKWT